MKKLTLGTKLTASSAALVLLTMSLSYMCITSARSSHEMFEAVAGKASKKIRLAGLLNSYILELHRAQRGMIMYAFAKQEPGVEMCRRDFQRNLELMRQSLGEYHSLATRAVTMAELAQVRSDLDTWVPKYNEISRLCAAGTPESAIEITISTLPLVKDVERITAGFVEYQQGLLGASNREASSRYNINLSWSIVLLVLSAGIGGLALWVVRGTSVNLRQIAEEMEEGAAQVASAAGHVAASGQALAEGASQQAASLEETSASTEEINAMAQRNTENSRTAADVVTRSGEKFTQVSVLLNETVTAMGEITTSSDKISKIIKVIDEIAFQTNILALNAAVEAARAGSAGLGFAVVADEVRNLAQRSAQAAKDTSGLIAESIAKSRDGKAKVDQVAEAIRSVVQDSADVKELVEEVNTGSTEQAAGIGQIAKAVTQMEQVTQKTAADAEKSASAAEELSAQAVVVREVVGRLKAMVSSEPKATGQAAKTVRPPASSKPSDVRKLNQAILHHQPAGARPAASVGAVRLKNHQAIPLDDDFPDF